MKKLDDRSIVEKDIEWFHDNIIPFLLFSLLNIFKTIGWFMFLSIPITILFMLMGSEESIRYSFAMMVSFLWVMLAIYKLKVWYK